MIKHELQKSRTNVEQMKTMLRRWATFARRISADQAQTHHMRRMAEEYIDANRHYLSLSMDADNDLRHEKRRTGAFFEWLKWRLAGWEMRELHTWRTQHTELRRWLAEFPDVAMALDQMKSEVCGEWEVLPSIYELREILRHRVARDSVIVEIGIERQRQINVEGWTPEGDDKYRHGDLASAAACYATQGRYHHPTAGEAPPNWPWAAAWWKPKGYRRNLIRAAALLVAEVERLDRADEKHL